MITKENCRAWKFWLCQMEDRSNYAPTLVSWAWPTLPRNLPSISPQNSVMCNGQYRRHVITAQPSFHDVDTKNDQSKTYVEYVNKWSHVFYIQMQTHTPFAVDPLEKMAQLLMNVYFKMDRSANSKCQQNHMILFMYIFAQTSTSVLYNK